MNKKFLKGVAALFAVAVLGVSCSNNNPNTPKEKENFPSIVDTGATGGSAPNKATEGYLIASKRAGVDFTLTAEAKKIKNPKVKSFTIEDTADSSPATLDNTKWTVTLTDTGLTISTVDTTEAGKLKEDLVFKAVLKVTSDSHKDADVTLYGKLKTKTEITKDQIKDHVIKLADTVVVDTTTGSKNIKFDFTSKNFEASSYTIKVKGAAGSQAPDQSNKTLSRAAVLKKLKTQLTAKLTGTTEIEDAGANPIVVDVDTSTATSYKVKVTLVAKSAYVLPSDFDGVTIDFDLSTAIGGQNCTFAN